MNITIAISRKYFPFLVLRFALRYRKTIHSKYSAVAGVMQPMNEQGINMSHIVALKGRANSGKSTTIKLVAQLLQQKYPNAPISVLISNTSDIKIIMNINGTKVGIESQGDPNSRLQQSLTDFVNAKCGVIICATRTSGMTFNWVNNYLSSHKITFIQQTYSSPANYSASSNSTASQIILACGL